MNALRLIHLILLAWKRRRLRRALVGAIILALFAVNGMAYMQARAMTHYTDTKHRTLAPESLTAMQKIEVLFTGVRVPRPENLVTPADFQLTFQTVRFGGPSTDDCEAWYVPGNSKTLVIGCPGYAASKSSLLGSAAAFHQLGVDVMLVDFRGTGGSRGDLTTIGYNEADDVAAAVAFARRQWPGERIVLYGQSMGGAAILRAVGELHVAPSGIIIESVYNRLLSTVENRFTAMHVPTFPLSQLLMFWGSVEMGYNGFALNPADFAEHVRCPALLLQGGRDPRVTDAEARNLFDHLAGPKTWDYYPGASHCEFLAAFSNHWKASVTHFLGDTLPATGD